MDTIDVYLDKLCFKSYYELPIVRAVSKRTNLAPQMVILAVIAILAVLSLSSFLGNSTRGIAR